MKNVRNHLKSMALALPFFVSSLQAQQPIDLKTAMKYAVEHHSSVQKAKIDIAKGEELVRESLSSGLPQLSGGLNLTDNLAVQTSFVPAEFFGGQAGEFAKVQFGTTWNASAGLQLNQKLFDKTWLLGLRASREVTDFYKLVLDKNKDQVVADVAKLYFQIQLGRTQRGIFEANLGQIKGLLTVTQKQYENGFGKKIDVDRLRVQQSNLETQIINLDLQIKQAEQALKFSMAMPLETNIVLTDTISETMFDEVNSAIAQPGYTSKPDLLILKKQQELYQLDVERWKAGYFPTLSFFGSYNYLWQSDKLSEISNGNFWTDFSQIGLQLNVPIFDGFFKKSKVQTAQLNIQQTAQNYNLAKLGLQLNHEAAITSLAVNQNTLRSIVEIRKVAEDVYRVAQSRYKEGLAPITELLDAETSLRQTQSNYITTLAQIKLAEIEILSANGLLLRMIEQ
ncbi:MAG: TolC family protein [Saprospiraceae bacterium]|nr:TolC family protein [Saprospiraceae bacterium]MCF8249306.1 TolC family protein [Saprospiraceae bacterium]MCF8279727.1 TolC family protein [Bacteroidales bacterium]MCF8311417.1 TolC family protein [Saprospiraceae bacterium]MCF8439925.1 TolC family protein [Saprospiraceae bacterium]